MVGYNKEKYMSIMIRKDIAEKLEKHKIIPGESWNALFDRILAYTLENNIDLSQRDNKGKFMGVKNGT